MFPAVPSQSTTSMSASPITPVLGWYRTVVSARTFLLMPPTSSKQLNLLSQVGGLAWEHASACAWALFEHQPCRKTTRWVEESAPTVIELVGPPYTSESFVQGAVSPGWVALVQAPNAAWTASRAGSVVPAWQLGELFGRDVFTEKVTALPVQCRPCPFPIVCW